MRFLALLLTLLLGTPYSWGTQLSSSLCELGLNAKGHGVANGVVITGEKTYKLPSVLRNLGIASRAEREAFRNKEILSLGEGISGLTPFLREGGLDAKGLDLWYHSSDLPQGEAWKAMREYQEAYGAHLIRGDARDLRSVIPDASVDLVLCHMLLNNFVKQSDENKALAEIVRILKPGGSARIAHLSMPDIARQTYRHLTRTYGDRFKISYQLVGTHKETPVFLFRIDPL